MNKLSPSQACIDAGLPSLKALSRITGESSQTLINWHKRYPWRFEIILQGALVYRDLLLYDKG